jgi:hypothetical protein
MENTAKPNKELKTGREFINMKYSDLSQSQKAQANIRRAKLGISEEEVRCYTVYTDNGEIKSVMI